MWTSGQRGELVRRSVVAEEPTFEVPRPVGEEATVQIGSSVPIRRPDTSLCLKLEIRLTVAPKVVSGSRMTIRISHEVTRLAPVVADDQDVPETNTQRIQTEVTLSPGQTGVVGGFVSATEFSDVGQIQQVSAEDEPRRDNYEILFLVTRIAASEVPATTHVEL